MEGLVLAFTEAVRGSKAVAIAVRRGRAIMGSSGSRCIHRVRIFTDFPACLVTLRSGHSIVVNGSTQMNADDADGRR
jgi:hypothetical protein